MIDRVYFAGCENKQYRAEPSFHVGLRTTNNIQDIYEILSHVDRLLHLYMYRRAYTGPVEIRLKMADPNLIVGALPGGVSLSRYIRNGAQLGSLDLRLAL